MHYIAYFADLHADLFMDLDADFCIEIPLHGNRQKGASILFSGSFWDENESSHVLGLEQIVGQWEQECSILYDYRPGSS